MPEFDSPWKEAIDRFFAFFLAFFFPWIYAEADATKDWESLEQEMPKLLPESLIGKRLADKLVKLFTRIGDVRIVHVEVQGDREAEFERRMEIYNYRAADRFDLPVVSIAVLTDEDRTWRPSEYVFSLWGCERRLKFVTVKILDWAGREAELEAHENPFALFVLANLKSREFQDDVEERRRAKLGLLLNLNAKKLDGEEMRLWYRWLDHLQPLPKAVEDELIREVREYEEGKKMPYVTSAERYGMEQGLEAGLKEGRNEGRKEGRNEGRKEGLQQGIEVVLRVKFGSSSADVMPEVRKLDDVARLKALLAAAEAAASLDDFRKLLPATRT